MGYTYKYSQLHTTITTLDIYFYMFYKDVFITSIIVETNSHFYITGDGVWKLFLEPRASSSFTSLRESSASFAVPKRMISVILTIPPAIW